MSNYKFPMCIDHIPTGRIWLNDCAAQEATLVSEESTTRCPVDAAGSMGKNAAIMISQGLSARNGEFMVLLMDFEVGLVDFKFVCLILWIRWWFHDSLSGG